MGKAAKQLKWRRVAEFQPAITKQKAVCCNRGSRTITDRYTETDTFHPSQPPNAPILHFLTLNSKLAPDNYRVIKPGRPMRETNPDELKPHNHHPTHHRPKNSSFLILNS